MYLQAIMILGALFGFIYALRLKETYSRVINWTMVVAVGITFVKIPQVVADGYYLFVLTQLGVIVYGASGSDFSAFKKTLLICSGLLTLIPAVILLSGSSETLALTGITHYYAEIATLTGVVQLGLFVYAIRSEIQNYKEEMGFLIILSADALVRVIGGVMFFAGV